MPHTPLTPTQFHALLPYLLPRSPVGRQIGDLRARMDAIFALSCTSHPWRMLPPEHGKPDTIARYFRRLTHAGLWEKLLLALKDNNQNHPLNQIAPLIFRACRRAIRLRGLRLIALIRRLGFLHALNGPPHKVANPHLSEKLCALRLPSAQMLLNHLGAARVLLRARRALHRLAGGAATLSRNQRLAWS